MKDPNEVVLWIMEEVDSWKDVNGINHKRGAWKIADKTISLGSYTNPNEKILMIKYAPRGLNLSSMFH